MTISELICVNKNTKAQKLFELNNTCKGDKVISIEQHIDKFYDNIIQVEIMPEHGFTLHDAVQQALRHGPKYVVVEKALV